MPDALGVLIVDGANWSISLDAKKLRVNYDLLIYQLERRARVKLAGLLYYTTFRNQEDLHRRRAFFNYLRDLGWQVQVMPATLGVDGVWRDKEVDIAIALDAYEEARSGHVSAVMIGSGDEDFGALFRRLPDGVQGWSVGFRGNMARSLKDVSQVVFLEDLGVLQAES